MRLGPDCRFSADDAVKQNGAVRIRAQRGAPVYVRHHISAQISCALQPNLTSACRHCYEFCTSDSCGLQSGPRLTIQSQRSWPCLRGSQNRASDLPVNLQMTSSCQPHRCRDSGVPDDREPALGLCGSITLRSSRQPRRKGGGNGRCSYRRACDLPREVNCAICSPWQHLTGGGVSGEGQNPMCDCTDSQVSCNCAHDIKSTLRCSNDRQLHQPGTTRRQQHDQIRNQRDIARSASLQVDLRAKSSDTRLQGDTAGLTVNVPCRIGRQAHSCHSLTRAIDCQNRLGTRADSQPQLCCASQAYPARAMGLRWHQQLPAARQ
jgi:hypothetical protein